MNFDEEIWGYSLLDVLMSSEEKLPSNLLQPFIKTIQSLLVND